MALTELGRLSVSVVADSVQQHKRGVHAAFFLWQMDLVPYPSVCTIVCQMASFEARGEELR